MRHSLLPRSIRRRLRRPSVYLVAAVALAVLTGTIAYGQLAAAARGARRYGNPVAVAVARVDLRAGDRIDADSVEVRLLPHDAVPPTAVRSASIGRVVRTPVGAGQVLVFANLTEPGTSRLAAALPAGTVALAVPRGDAAIRVVPGDRVDLLSVTRDGAQKPVTTDAKVLAADAKTVTVAVRIDDAGRVAAAITAGTVIPALRAG
jgi:Flp pilus assembly protein CpaB